jgi:hypothetical protein
LAIAYFAWSVTRAAAPAVQSSEKTIFWTSQWPQFSAHEEHPGHAQLLKEYLHADGAVADGKRFAHVV